MTYFTGFLICLSMALINLPFVLMEGGSVANLISMIFCGALALHQLIKWVDE